LEVLERSDCLNLFGDQGALRDKCKSEEEKNIVEQKESCAIGNTTVSTNNHLKQQPPAPVVSAVAAGKGQVVATYNKPVASMSANQPQPPTPVISTTVPQQQRTYNTGALTSTNNNPSNNGSSSSVTLVPQNQYKPISVPAMPHRPHQVSVSHSTHNNNYNNLNSNANANNNGNNTWNNNTHNPTKIMHPPQPVSRGISPENAPGVIIDTSKRALPVQNHLGNNSSLDNDSNKRQKRNPYTNNRLSC